MTPLVTEIIGYSAAVVGTCLMLPQIIKTIKTRHAADISIWMLLLYLLNCSLWLVYGILINAVPVILCNTLAFFIGLAQIILKKRYS